VDIAVLGEDAGSRDGLCALVVYAAKDPCEEGLFQHHLHPMRLEVEGGSKLLIDVTDRGDVSASGLFVHSTLPYNTIIPQLWTFCTGATIFIY